jgi:hypothetical protein
MPRCYWEATLAARRISYEVIRTNWQPGTWVVVRWPAVRRLLFELPSVFERPTGSNLVRAHRVR